MARPPPDILSEARLRLAGVLALFALALGAGFAAPHAGLALTNCTVDANVDSEERALLDLINDHREDNGLDPLSLSSALTRAAAWKARDMADNDYFDHDDTPSGRTWSQRIRDCGYTANTFIGENIAAGNETAAATFDQWRNSAGHNAAMLSENFAAIGIGRASNEDSRYRWYWVTDFGGVADAAPPPGSDPDHDGDADCNGVTTTVDAALVLQLTAGIVASLRCQDAADVNTDGSVGAVDAAIILQYAAGVIGSLPV